MQFRGMEMLGTILRPDGLPDVAVDKPGANLRGGGGRYTDHQYGFWSHDTEGPHTVAKVTIDPKSNNGERAEVSIKGISDGKPMGAGPGGNFISDVEIRYTLGRNEPGVYTYSIFEHQPSYPPSSLGEARFCTKLNDFFDWMSVGPKWNKPYPKAAAGEHEDKYDFTANQFENPAFGWSSIAGASARHLDQDRHPSFPDIPPLGDAVPGFEAVSWQAMAAPAQTPRPILDKLNAEITAVLAMPEVKEQTLKYGFLPLQNRSVDELKEFVKSEIVRWGKVVRDAGIAGSQ